MSHESIKQKKWTNEHAIKKELNSNSSSDGSKLIITARKNLGATKNSLLVKFNNDLMEFVNNRTSAKMDSVGIHKHIIFCPTQEAALKIMGFCNDWHEVLRIDIETK